MQAGFREFLGKNGRVVLQLPAGTFQESGTMVETVVEITRMPLDEALMPLLAA